MIPWNKIEDRLYEWFSGATGLTTIWAEEDGPRPDLPYATLKVISGPDRYGLKYDKTMPPYDHPSTALALLSGQTPFTLSTNIYGPGATDYMRMAKYSLSLPDFVEDMKQVQSTEIEIITVTDSVTYTVSVNGYPSTYTSGVGATQAAIQAGLVLAINANVYINSMVTATPDVGPASLFLEADPGIEFDVTVGDAKLSYTNNEYGLSISVESESEIRDLTALQDGTKHEDRKQMDINCNTVLNYWFTQDDIAKVSITDLINSEIITIDAT